MLKKNNIDFHNILAFDKKYAKNTGGGGNINSSYFSVKQHLKEPNAIVREQYFKQNSNC
jgi:hypothetical protein